MTNSITLIVIASYIDHFLFTETPELLMSYPKCIPPSTIYGIGVFSPVFQLGLRNKVISSKLAGSVKYSLGSLIGIALNL